MNLNNGRLDPLMRIRREIRNFFLYHVLSGVPNAANTDRGVNRLLGELQPFLDNLVSLMSHLLVNITYLLFNFYASRQ